jgi:hypothetical protein
MAGLCAIALPILKKRIFLSGPMHIVYFIRAFVRKLDYLRRRILDLV